MIGIIFWPFMILSVIVSVLGVIFVERRWMYLASALLAPMSLYLAGTPRFSFWGLLFPLLYVLAGFSIRKHNRWLSLLLAAPNYFLIAWLGYTVLHQ